jgi:hypothetical protein
MSLPAELGGLIEQLARWQTLAAETASAGDAEDDTGPHPGLPPGSPRHAKPIGDAILGGRFAQAAYRLQLMPLVGDAQARTLKGLTGDLARSPWTWQLSPRHIATPDEAVSLISEGFVRPLTEAEIEAGGPLPPTADDATQAEVLIQPAPPVAAKKTKSKRKA